MTYYVDDNYDWHNTTSYPAAVELALDLQKRDTQEPVRIFEEIDWHRCITPHEAKSLNDQQSLA